MNFCCSLTSLKSPVNLVVVVLSGTLLTGCGLVEHSLGIDQTRKKTRWRKCESNLKQVGLGLTTYAGLAVNDGRFPENLEQLWESESYKGNGITMYENGEKFGCPSADSPAESAADSDYVYVGAGLRDTNRDPTTTRTRLAYCSSANHKNNLFIDGTVRGYVLSDSRTCWWGKNPWAIPCLILFLFLAVYWLAFRAD